MPTLEVLQLHRLQPVVLAQLVPLYALLELEQA